MTATSTAINAASAIAIFFSMGRSSAASVHEGRADGKPYGRGAARRWSDGGVGVRVTRLAEPARFPSVGALVGGRYELLRVLGSGGMGEVWEARDRELDNLCALKVILGHIARDASVRSRFARE